MSVHVTRDHHEGIGDVAELVIMTDDKALLPDYRQPLLILATRLGLCSEQRETRSYRTLCEQSLTLDSKRLPL
jgi:adenylate cyclase class 2